MNSLLIKAGVLAALMVFLTTIGWVKGSGHVQAKWDAANLSATVVNAQHGKRQAEVTTQVVTQYVDRWRTVHDAGQTIIKEVPVYVPADSPALPGGFRLLHDAAATGQLPDAAGSADAATVSAQDAAETVAGNYLTCRENAEQLMALQGWVREQRGIR